MGTLVLLTSSAMAVRLGSVLYPELDHGLGKLYGFQLGALLPAVDGDPSFPGIDAHDYGLAEVAACLLDQRGVFYGGGAQDNAVYARFQQLFYCRQVADAAPGLGGNQ